MAASHDRSLALDGIRGIAAVAVMLFHGGLDLKVPWCVGHGWLAVDVFFVMSGCVVERAYGERLRGGWPVRSFAWVRFRRLYPIYLLGLLLGALLRVAVLAGVAAPIAADALGLSLVAGALLIPIPLSGCDQVFPLNGPSWSLLVEVVANGGFAIVPRRFGILCLAAAIGIAAAVVVTAVVVGLPLAYGGRPGSLWLDFGRGAFGFGVGVALGLATRGGGLGWVPRLPTPSIFIVLIAILLVPRGPLDPWVDPLAVLVLGPVIVALAAVSRPVGRVARVCAGAGAVSYPLYMVHAPILFAAHRLAPQGIGQVALQALWTGTAAALALALAWSIARWIEPGLARTRAPGGTAAAEPALTAVRVRG